MARQRDERERQEERTKLRAHAENRRELESRHGVYEGDPVAEAREERSRNFDIVVSDWLTSSPKPT